MKVHFICGYYSDRAHKVVRRPEAYWEAHFFVWAVKFGTYKRDFTIGSKRPVRVTKDKIGKARELFGRFVSQCVATYDDHQQIYVVPVPSKDALRGSTASRSLKMVQEALTTSRSPLKIANVLHWRTAQTRAHEGGTRDRKKLADLLEVTGSAEGLRIVLVDDLLSTGGTLLACKDVLEQAGATVACAVTCGKTIYDFKIKAWGNQSCELVDELADFGQFIAAQAIKDFEEH